MNHLLAGLALAVLQRLFPPERPSEAELIAYGATQERARQSAEHHIRFVEETPTIPTPSPLLLPVVPSPLPEPGERHTDQLALARLQQSWWYHRASRRDPETEQHPSV